MPCAVPTLWAEPDNVVENETDQEEGVPVHPPSPAPLQVSVGLVPGGGGGGGGGVGEGPGEDVVEEGVVVVGVLHLSESQESHADPHQEHRQPQHENISNIWLENISSKDLKIGCEVAKCSTRPFSAVTMKRM